MGKLDELGDSVRQVIRAFHGSPHDFDKFDASKIGTGEGNQSYGHGLYFAGSEDTADVYRKSLTAIRRSPMEDALELWRRHSERSGNPRNAVGYALDSAEESLEEAAGIPDAQKRWREVIQHLYELDYRQPIPDRPGRTYEVEISHPEEALLNWDRPTAPAGGVGSRAAEVLRAVSPRDIDQGSLDFIRSVRPGGYSKPGYGTAIDSVERALQKLAQDPAGAEELRSAGIPGVRYLDGVSRSSGSGTRNYVMFPGTEDSIRILRKYAIPGAVGAGVASQYGEE
jgi:hypothetical protein